MDARHFDTLVRSLSEAGSRRGVLAILAALPVLGVLFTLLDDEAEAKGRRKRRKKAHKHGKGRRRKHHKTCKANSLAKTCAGKCGTVKNNCKKSVDCGSCACDPPCAVCQTCDASTGQCTNLTDGTSCGEGLQCQAGQCVCDGTSCADGCCQNGLCHVDDDDACGTGGGSCIPCTPPNTCGGGGTDGQCGCTPDDPCTAGVCGTVQDTCGGDVDCGACSNPTPICVNHICTACDGMNPCPGGQCCSGGQCVASCPACESCSAGVCAPCADCCAGGICQDGTSNTACGSSGTCVDCTASNQACVSQQCTCTAGSCASGCCQGGTCHTGDEDAACGIGGGACTNCGPGRHCVNGACVCDSTSCPTGCCDGNGQCQVNNVNACGKGGVSCAVSCADDRVCSSGTCVTCASVCAGCVHCTVDFDGSWRCTQTPSSTDCSQSPCTASSACVGGRTCTVRRILVSDGSVLATGPICGQAAGTGTCSAATACTGT